MTNHIRIDGLDFDPAFKDEVERLQEQANFFGLEIDWENLELVEPENDSTPGWLKNWREKQLGADVNNRFDFDNPNER